MISINGRLDSNEINDFIHNNQDEFNRIEQLTLKRKLTSKDFNSKLWSNSEIKNKLMKLHFGKCCYCELPLRPATIEHYRPKTRVQIQGKIKRNIVKDHKGYWWLAYHPENFIVSCGVCNSRKGDLFPLLNEGDRCYTQSDDLTNEQPIILNPMYEEGSLSSYIDFEFFYDLDTKIISIDIIGTDPDNRGQKTIDILKLNEEDNYSLYNLWESRIQVLINGIKNFSILFQGNLQNNEEIIKFRDLLKNYLENILGSREDFLALKRSFLLKTDFCTLFNIEDTLGLNFNNLIRGIVNELN